jgi:hypothetical protein
MEENHSKAELYESLRAFIHEGRPSDPVVKAAQDLRVLLSKQEAPDERASLGQVRSTAA